MRGSWRRLGHYFGDLRPSWERLGRSWGRLGGALGRLGASWGRLGGVLRHLDGVSGATPRKTSIFDRFLLPTSTPETNKIKPPLQGELDFQKIAFGS